MLSPAVLALSNRNTNIFLFSLFEKSLGLFIHHTFVIDSLICRPLLQSASILGLHHRQIS